MSACVLKVEISPFGKLFVPVHPSDPDEYDMSIVSGDSFSIVEMLFTVVVYHQPVAIDTSAFCRDDVKYEDGGGCGANVDLFLRGHGPRDILLLFFHRQFW